MVDALNPCRDLGSLAYALLNRANIFFKYVVVV